MRQNELPRGLRNNNPGNIRRNSDVFQGEVNPSRDKEFKQFKNMAYGYRAMFKILSNYYNKYQLNTIREMISRWAPENENNTAAYVSLVSIYAGIAPDALISFDREQMIRIVAGMSKVENGREAVMSDVIAGWNLL
ncbi:structural protein P5 [Parabacteroides sp. W1-Q-101]|uniref:structural protein P5 n=1 Tax=Parabacteroides caeci TaxID=2949650 RepID=UPI00202DEA89|nr:structural protein P5 [Parabacteroides sp. W1-Q-101]MCM0721617.1 structural protein P5 [Parabacteroides sp. W1-Q-101]